MKFFVGFVVILSILFSCGKGNKNHELKDQVSSFLNENPTIASFGKIDITTLLEKADYKQVPKIGLIVSSVLDEFKKTIKLETPIFYAAEGPFNEKGATSIYAFIEVINADSLVQQLTQKGYDFDEKGDLNLTQFDNFSLGIQNNLAILLYRPEAYEAEDFLVKAFERTAGDLASDKVNKLLAAKGDMTFGVNMESILSTSNTELEKLGKGKKEELQKMVKNSYSQLSVDFRKGEAVITAHHFFSEELKKKLFFNSDPDAKIISKLGKGEPRAGLSVNLDMGKIQQFINDYSPNALNKLGQEVGGPIQMALMMGGEDALSNLFTGSLGFVLLGEPGMNGSMIPDFNFHMGLGKKGQSMAEMAKSFLANGTMKTEINSQGISCYSSSIYQPETGQKINLPVWCESFGKKSVSGFINFEGVDIHSFELEGAAKAIEIIQYITFELDAEQGKMYIKAKNNNVNILKQVVNFFMKDLENQLSNLPI